MIRFREKNGVWPSEQLNCTTKNLNEYWKIKNTKTRYFQEILDIFGYIKFKYTSDLEKEFYKIAFSNGNSSVMGYRQHFGNFVR